VDLFLAGCQGLGLALAAGGFGGASGRDGAIGALLLLSAMIGGGALFGWSLDQEDYSAWPGFIAGAAFAAFAFVVVRAIAEGAVSRTDGEGFTGAIIALAALVLAGLSLVVSPIALVALALLLWVSAGRRRKAAEKYEGLRTLR
jgi:hypothetical protein